MSDPSDPSADRSDFGTILAELRRLRDAMRAVAVRINDGLRDHAPPPLDRAGWRVICRTVADDIGKAADSTAGMLDCVSREQPQHFEPITEPAAAEPVEPAASVASVTPLKPKNRKYTLNELLADVPQAVAHPARPEADAGAATFVIDGVDVECETCATWTASIYVGLRAGYTDRLVDADRVKREIRYFCNKVGFCVSVTPTEFLYTKTATADADPRGDEPGLIVGLIAYPRFVEEIPSLVDKAMRLAAICRNAAEQHRVSVVFPDRTVMVGAKARPAATAPATNATTGGEPS